MKSFDEKFGATTVLKDKSSGEWEQIKAQWVIGKSIVDFACTHYVSLVEGGYKKTVLEFSTFGVDSVDRVKQLTPLIALRCDFKSAIPKFDTGESFGADSAVRAFTWDLLIDVDTADVGLLSGASLDNDAKVDSNHVNASWKNKNNFVESELTISRLDGRAEYRARHGDTSVQHDGQCKKIDPSKKLF